MSYVGVAVQPEDWLSDEANNIGPTTGHQMDVTLFSTLQELEFADDIALVSHTHQLMQEKTTRLSVFAQQVGLKISQKKTELMMLNIPNPSPFKVNGEDLPTTEECTYLSCTVMKAWRRSRQWRQDKQGPGRLQNAKQFVGVIPVQHPEQAKTVLSALLYASECWSDWEQYQPTVHLLPRQHCYHYHVKTMEISDMWWEGARQHLPHSTSLGTREETETRATKDHLASNCRRGAQDFLHHNGTWGTVHNWPRTDRSGVSLLLPYMPDGITGTSE